MEGQRKRQARWTFSTSMVPFLDGDVARKLGLASASCYCSFVSCCCFWICADLLGMLFMEICIDGLFRRMISETCLKFEEDRTVDDCTIGR